MYAVLGQDGGQEQPCVGDAQANHKQHFGRPPRLLVADHGMAPTENERLAKDAGVMQVAITHAGEAGHERGRRSRGSYRFRAVADSGASVGSGGGSAGWSGPMTWR
jgi:hypothetical protein